MRIQRYERQIGQPGTTGTQKLQGMGAAEDATSRALAATAHVMAQQAQLNAELEARQRASERSMKLDRLSMTYRVGYASWFETRAQDPMAYGSLLSDATEAQAKLRDEAMKEAAGDQELQAALALRFDEHDGLKRIEAQRVAGQQLAEVSRGQLRATLTEAASLYANASGFERPDIMASAVNAIGAQVRAGAITADQGTALAQEFTDTAYGNDIARRIETDPRGVLDDIKAGAYAGATEKLLVAGERGARDEIKRLQAEAERERARAEAAHQARLRVAERAYEDVARILDAGVQVDAQTMKTARSLVAGTELETQFNAMLVGYKDRARFAAAPIVEQAAELAALQRRATTEGVDGQGVRELQARTRIFEAAQRDALADPLLAARDRGVVGDLTPIDLSSPDALAESLRTRAPAADAAAVWIGRTVPLLTKAETAGLADALAKAPVQDRRQLLLGLRRGLDDEQYIATLGQLSADSPLPAYAGALAMHEGAPFAMGNASALLLEGEGLIRPAKGEKPLPLPSEPTRRLAFNDAVGDAFTGYPRVYDQTRQATDAIYAALSARAGDFEGLVVDPERYQKAVRLATSNMIRINDRYVPKPTGMTDVQFRELIRRTDAATVARLGGVPRYTDEQVAEAIQEGALHPYRDGYAVSDGQNFLKRKDGRGFFVWRPSAVALYGRKLSDFEKFTLRAPAAVEEFMMDDE